jgi:hypothetical protein
MVPKSMPVSVLVSLLLAFVVITGSCSTGAAKDNTGNVAANTAAKASKGDSIAITPNSPAETVRAFYAKLREGKFREAIHLTNLRPAIEGLTDDELKEFSVDFAAIAKLVPPEIEINGEIISGDVATVTAKLPGDDDELELQELQLRKRGGYWVILTVDEETEKAIEREGKNYFFALKIETHQDEAKAMLERVAKAQMAFSLQNQGVFADVATLVEVGYLPADIATSDSTGYVYVVYLSPDKRSYYATATPAVYGKTGKMSYILRPVKGGLPVVSGADNNGKPLTK